MQRLNDERLPTGESEIQSGAETLSTQAEAVLQRAIVAGELAPDVRLTLASLEQRYGFGATPLREALSRLVARRLVVVTCNKGFSVSAISRQDLEDLIRTRSVVEVGALKMSMQNRDVDWEDGLVLALHRFKRAVRVHGPLIPAGDLEYEAAHRAFHQALIGGCRSPRLIEMQGELFDQTFRYRRVMSDEGLDADLTIKSHQGLADLALAGRTEEACSSLKEHLLLSTKDAYADALHGLREQLSELSI